MTDTHAEIDPTEIHLHLKFLQDIVARMAMTSAQCKTWCVTITAAVLVLASRADDQSVIAVAFVPAFLLGGLDSFYLGLERFFRAEYTRIVSRLHTAELARDEVFRIAGPAAGAQFSNSLRAACSPAIWPFYGGLVALILLLEWIQRTPTT